MIAAGGSSTLTQLQDPRTSQAFAVEVGGRSFPVADPAEAADAGTVARALARLARPGDSLFVGPEDLRYTNYADTYLYYLLPELRPASFYMELNPQTANRSGSGLADSLAHATWLILTSRYGRGSEPNSSQRAGSSLPNDVVRREFCRRVSRGEYVLLQRCRS